MVDLFWSALLHDPKSWVEGRPLPLACIQLGWAFAWPKAMAQPDPK